MPYATDSVNGSDQPTNLSGACNNDAFSMSSAATTTGNSSASAGDTDIDKTIMHHPCYITVENEDGHLEKFKIDLDDDQFTVHPKPYKLEAR